MLDIMTWKASTRDCCGSWDFPQLLTWYRRKPPKDHTVISNGTEVSTASNCSLDLPRNAPTSFKVCTLSITSLLMISVLKYCFMVRPEAWSSRIKRPISPMGCTHYTSMPQITEKDGKNWFGMKQNYKAKVGLQNTTDFVSFSQIHSPSQSTILVCSWWPCCYYCTCAVKRCYL